ncbi:MAG: shikimate dehydrogenase [Candidatus Binatia bacterium]
MSAIRATTRVVAILGDPVEHSLSPVMHNAAFAALGLDFAYVALRVRPAALEEAIEGVRALGFAGLNVTVPHKEAVLSLLDDLSPAARAIGAVNTVVRCGDRLKGENTDGPGFLRAVARLGFRPRGKRAVVLGAGGSARAVAWALGGAGISRLTILNRSPKRAAALAARVRRGCGATVLVSGLDSPGSAGFLQDADIVVNCTSLGLDGRTAPNVPIAVTPRHCLFYDLVYRLGPTPLVRSAWRRGRRAENGLSMLVEQAALAFRIWTGRVAPVGAMRRALAR